MRMRVRVEVAPTKGGVMARIPDLHLAARGADEASALRRLRSVALTWGNALNRAMAVEKVLTNKGIDWVPTEDDEIAVDLLVESRL